MTQAPHKESGAVLPAVKTLTGAHLRDRVLFGAALFTARMLGLKVRSADLSGANRPQSCLKFSNLAGSVSSTIWAN